MMGGRPTTLTLAAAVFVAALATVPFARADAQYFGSNKVQYQDFHFKILKTQHFDIYYYPEELEAAQIAGRMAERWYARLSVVLNHQLSGRQPLILYASHPDFEQTNALQGQLGEGTGGVTEVLKRRIVLPSGGGLKETDHVIGHELVHAFQYDITGQGRSVQTGGYPGALRLPLWFIEGMAEYLSTGPVDANTAMWIRDAAIHGLPSVRDLNNEYKWFPYRYGEALWAFLAGRYGDAIVGDLLKRMGASRDPMQSMQTTLGTSLKALSAAWHRAIHDAYDPIRDVTHPASDYGRMLFGTEDRGGLYVSPALSPDGSKLAFISSKDLFSVDVYIADAATGKIIRKLTHTAVDAHFESIEFISSAGAWSPDGTEFAITGVSGGKPVLTVFNVETGDRVRDITLTGVDEAFTPAWSPDGKEIAFSAFKGGLSDLFVYNMESRTVERLTNDPYGDLQPAWSPDGKTIAFSSDRFTTDLQVLNYGDYRIALLDRATGRITPAPGFRTGKHLNPEWAPDGTHLYFVSDQNGIDNLYRVSLTDGAIDQITNLYGGVSGITAMSPTLTVASQSGAVAFSAFYKDGYRIYQVSDSALTAAQPPQGPFAAGNPAMLPPVGRAPSQLTGLLADNTTGLPDTAEFKSEPYHPSLSLDYIAQPSLLLGADRFGTYIGGGAALYWSDMLGNHNLATMLQVNGSLKDIAALAQYVNLTHRLNWGVQASQIPYLAQYYNAVQGIDTTNGNQDLVLLEQIRRFRQTDRGAGVMLQYPFSRVQRVELQAGFDNISFTDELRTIVTSELTGQTLYDSTVSLNDTPPALNLVSASGALVFDNALYGATGPILGQRYRFQATPVVGTINYVNLLGDFRKYWVPVRPFTLAVRAMTYGRYFSASADSVLAEYFIGYPDLIHGYQYGSFSASECQPGPSGSCEIVDRLFGTKIAVGNAELRFPLLGVLGLGGGYYGAFPIDMFFFGDAGLAWDSQNEPWFTTNGTRKPVYSTGAGIRVNLLGFAVITVDFAHAFQRHRNVWEFSFSPGF